MALTIEEARNLKYREVLVDSNGKRWYVNGKVRTWKRNAGRLYVPLKHGLYAYGFIDEGDFIDGVHPTLRKEEG